MLHEQQPGASPVSDTATGTLHRNHKKITRPMEKAAAQAGDIDVVYTVRTRCLSASIFQGSHVRGLLG